MNCAEVETSLIEIARGEDANPAARKRALMHTRSCAFCAARFDSEQALSDCLDALQVEMLAEAAPSPVESALLAEFRLRHVTSLPEPIRSPRRFHQSRWLLAAAAVLAIIALAVAAVRLRTAPRQTAPETQKASEETREFNPTTVSPDEKHAAKVPDPSERLKSTQHAQRKVKRAQRFYDAIGQADRRGAAHGDPAAQTEIATEFFPMGSFGDFSDVESGQILRVELPRSALLSFGLPVDPEREHERVKADVLLGNDGLARAIRFVR